MSKLDAVAMRPARSCPPRTSLLALCALGALCILGAAGCSSDSVGGDASAHPEPAKNQQRWLLPLDRYSLESTRRVYGQNLLIAPCMKAAGQTFEVPRIDFSDRPATRNGVLRKLFDVELAKRYGYHGGPGGYLDDQPSNGPLSDAAAKVFDRCLEPAQKKIPDLSSDQQYVDALAGSAYDEAMGSSTVVAAAKRWKACMKPLGMSDLPDRPVDFPTEAVRQRFGMNPDPATGEPERDRASVEEIRLAVADATCQKTSGYADALYAEEWDLEIKALDRNEPELSRIMETKRAVEARLDDVIEKQGG